MAAPQSMAIDYVALLGMLQAEDEDMENSLDEDDICLAPPYG